MSKSTRFILCGGLVLIGIALYVLGVIILPATIGFQMQLDGTMNNLVNKYIGLLIPLVLTVGGSVFFFIKEESKALGFSALGVLLSIITLWMNLR